VPPKILNAGDANKRALKVTSSMCISSIIVTAGLADKRTMNESKRRKKEDENSKLEGIRRKQLLK